MALNGQDLLNRRKELQCTQDAFAKLLGISRSHLAKLEVGSAPLSSKLSLALDRLPLKKGMNGRTVREVQIRSWAQAGAGVDFEELPLDWQRSVPTSCPDREAFGLELRGDSMEPKYSTGDVLVVMPSNAPRTGSLVVLRLVEGDVMFKLFNPGFAGEETVTFTSFNPAYSPISVSRESIEWVYPIYEVIRKTWEGPVQCV